MTQNHSHRNGIQGYELTLFYFFVWELIFCLEVPESWFITKPLVVWMFFDWNGRCCFPLSGRLITFCQIYTHHPVIESIQKVYKGDFVIEPEPI